MPEGANWQGFHDDEQNPPASGPPGQVYQGDPPQNPELLSSQWQSGPQQGDPSHISHQPNAPSPYSFIFDPSSGGMAHYNNHFMNAPNGSVNDDRAHISDLQYHRSHYHPGGPIFLQPPQSASASASASYHPMTFESAASVRGMRQTDTHHSADNTPLSSSFAPPGFNPLFQGFGSEQQQPGDMWAQWTRGRPITPSTGPQRTLSHSISARPSKFSGQAKAQVDH
ncbi:hypothetical protein M231_06750 [Tremella mesenterica]|uniref:Uncharacterized protein n=1 Tax=Tremella mesenterica TaxID=5217 RepID=A0A4Q1BG17_TREME|nr:hypothetical protein M231_06750 [Tremella mesenterica]